MVSSPPQWPGKLAQDDERQAISPATSAPAIPSPTSICLTCRTALPSGAPCDGGPRHHVADLETVTGRKAHLQEVWGPASRQRRLRESVRNGVAGSSVGAALQLLDCGVSAGDTLGAAIAAIVLVGFLFVVVGYLASKLGDTLRRRRLLRPYGAVTRPRPPGPQDVTLGIAVGPPHPSPLQGEPCLAFSIVLRSTRPGPNRSDVLWREASTCGFQVRLDSGALVEIPAGRVRIVESSRGARRVSRDRAARRLPCGLGVDIPGELSELPFDLACEEIIRPNQRVAILSRVEPRENRTRLPASPREPPNLTLVAGGVPVLTRVEETRDAEN
jgi:hypothetical protein